ncbi:hypothetical protein NST23_14060 [Brevibacillus sp. FSL K6-0770]|uniref:hypothetical protein n=1 Tax=unclassified Brevibacillus TaxID=2684853 RepID=UPI00156ABC6E|nr:MULTISPECIES: hypothetical protein [unclassified Brevibacillus]MDH6351734.1 hypothetical protein [Brevibacillus sp. 1238]NRQ55392.1 hypothetical protein [Brevibacillus sp. HD1.4A]
MKTKEKVRSKINHQYKLRESPESFMLEMDHIALFFSKDLESLDTITVTGDYKGKIMDAICLGSTLHELKEFMDNQIEYDPLLDEYQAEGVAFTFSPPNNKGEQFLEHIVIYKSHSLE